MNEKKPKPVVEAGTLTVDKQSGKRRHEHSCLRLDDFTQDFV